MVSYITMLKEQIIQLVQTALIKLHIEKETVDIDYPLHAEFGDYATNIALKLAKKQSVKT